MPSADDVTASMLLDAMTGMGYECSERDEKSIRARHTTRMNVVGIVIREKGIILFLHSWKTKKGWRGVPKDAVNEVNRMCLMNTCYVDSDGDIAGSFYVPIASGFNEAELGSVLERADAEFRVAAAAKLIDHLD
jgi:hypothetical protein